MSEVRQKCASGCAMATPSAYVRVYLEPDRDEGYCCTGTVVQCLNEMVIAFTNGRCSRVEPPASM